MQSARMPGLLLVIATAITLILLSNPTQASQHKVEITQQPGRSLLNAPSKRLGPHVVEECVKVTSESGRFFVRAPPDADGQQVCGLYLTAEADANIRLQFDYFDVPCDEGGLVAFVDGWELNGEFFPSASDHEKQFDDRFEEFCGVQRIKKSLQSSQNAALLQYRFPKNTGQPHGFSFTVRHIPNPRPCNILAESTSNVYTMRNYGRRVNCSITMLVPGKIQIIAMQVGVMTGSRPLIVERETGILHKCRKRGSDDYLEIGGSKGLDTAAMTIGHELCGMDSKPEGAGTLVGCPITTVRLISTGIMENSATIMLHTADESDFSDANDDTVLCFQ